MVWVLRDFRARFQGKRALNIVSFIWKIVLRMSSLYRHSAIWKWFAIWPKPVSARLKAAGAQFHEWIADGLSDAEKPADGEDLVRLVTSFATAAHEVDHFLKALGK